jgi:NAD(P)-dependent dehydrogenase (short-subunit alcohol dehydrogenase family)
MNADSRTERYDLTGQVAIVTGGGRGIGRAIAQALAEAGAKVAVASRTHQELNETVALIVKTGGQAIAVAVDVTDERAVEHMVQETHVQLGPVDLLVNNAGVGGTLVPIWEAAADEWWRVLEINLRGPFLCARAVLPGMVARRHGRIINIASNAGIRPTLTSSYSVSKAALLRFTDCLAESTREHGIAVFAISPGLVHTAMSDAVPIFKSVPESEWYPAERAGELCALLAAGAADRLSGRYIHVRDDIQELIRRADEIVQGDLYSLRLRQ